MTALADHATPASRVPNAKVEFHKALKTPYMKNSRTKPKKRAKPCDVEIAKILHTMQRATPSPPPLKKREIVPEPYQADKELIGQALPCQPNLFTKPNEKRNNSKVKEESGLPRAISALDFERSYQHHHLYMNVGSLPILPQAQHIAKFGMPAFTPAVLRQIPQIPSYDCRNIAFEPLLSRFVSCSSLLRSNLYHESNQGVLSGTRKELNTHVKTTLPNYFDTSGITPIREEKEASSPISMQIPLCMEVNSNIVPSKIQPSASSKKVKDSPELKIKLCRMDSCNETAARRTPYCSAHSGPRRCEKEGCNKCAQSRTRFCISHGGGRRCTAEGCTKGARDRFYCAAHGGGRRCRIDKCSKLSVDNQGLCTAHGGGRRCEFDDCPRSAQSNTKFCVRHGGGRKCAIGECSKVARGKSGCCMLHSRITGQ